MQLQCVQCKAPITLDMTFCAACGRPVDADRNGLPDALDRKVQEAAKKAVVDERAAQDERDREGKERAQIHKKLELLASNLKSNRECPRSFVGFAIERMKTTFLAMCAAWVILGVPVHFISGALGFAISGPLVCAVQCAECHGTGRVFVWNYRGSWHSEKGRMGYALVCDNPRYDVSRLTWSDVRSEENNAALQPYMVHGFIAYLADGIVVAVLMALYVGLFRTHKALARLDPELKQMEREESELRARLAALDR